VTDQSTNGAGEPSAGEPALRDSPTDAPRGVNWLRLGIAAGATVILVVIAIAGFNSVIEEFSAQSGPTATAELQLGGCLADSDVGIAQYTVIDCAFEHPQQVVADVDLGRTSTTYNSTEALVTYVEEVCNRFIEYGIYIRADVREEQYDVFALWVPTIEEVASGVDRALCAVRSLDGTPLTEDLYQPVPGTE
jgi:hypothetical protein